MDNGYGQVIVNDNYELKKDDTGYYVTSRDVPEIDSRLIDLAHQYYANQYRHSFDRDRTKKIENELIDALTKASPEEKEEIKVYFDKLGMPYNKLFAEDYSMDMEDESTLEEKIMDDFEKWAKIVQDNEQKAMKESFDADPDEVVKLAQDLKTGLIDYEEFKNKLADLEYTEYSMRQGEMGNPDMRDDKA